MTDPPVPPGGRPDPTADGSWAAPGQSQPPQGWGPATQRPGNSDPGPGAAPGSPSGPGSPPPPGGPAAVPTGAAFPPPVGAPGAPFGQRTGALVRPGIIPLRPLGVGDILDGAVRAVRFNPAAMLGMALVVTLVTTAITLALRFLLGWRLSGPDGGAAPQPSVLIDPGSLVSQIGSAVLTGLVIHVVGEAVLGRRISLGQAWQAVKGRLLPLLGYQFLLAVAVVAAILTLIGILALPLLVYLIMVPAVLVLEKQGIRDSVRRSVALVRGAFWRTLGIWLLAGLIVFVVQVVLSAPLMAAVLVVANLVGAAVSDSLVIGTAEAVVNLVSGVLLTPFSAAVTALLYIDRRIRTEGLDIALMNHVGRGAGGGERAG